MNMHSPLLPRTKKKLHTRSTETKASAQIFKPNAGGQAELFSHIPLDEEYKGEYRYYLFKGGFNSGKTFCGAAFATSRSRLDPEARGLISANTFGQLETSTLVGLADFCNRYGHDLQPRAESIELTARKIAHNHYCTINGAYVYVLSAELFTSRTAKSVESARGIAVRWFWGDELLFADKSAFTTIDSRLGRGSGKMKGIGLITSTINRNNPYNWGYERFDDPDRDEKTKQLFKSINCPTFENIYADQDYIESLKASMTPELIQLEIEGKYAAISTGRVFPYFKREIHTSMLESERAATTYLSFDFNWSPATCIVGQKRRQRTEGREVLGANEELIIIKEFYLKNANTFVSTETVLTWLIKNELHRSPLRLCGDASGNQKTANSNRTNWDIVWEGLSKYGLKAYRDYPKSNPAVIDSVNSVNALLHHNRLSIDSGCKELIKDLEFLAWKEGSDPLKIDKSDIERSHLADCLRYLVSAFEIVSAPVSKPKAGWFY